MAKLQLALTEDEAEKNLMCGLLCQTRYGARWQTGKRRRLWEQQFTEDERKQAEIIFAACRRWFLKSGSAPVTLDIKIYDLWMRLIAFCGSL